VTQQSPPRTYFEIDFASGEPADGRRYVWRIRRTCDHEILSTSGALETHDACMAAIGILYQDAGRSSLRDRTARR
jgi:hypothetical protein